MSKYQYIKKVNYDKAYPYRISDGWGGEICLCEESLKALKKEINKILKAEKENNA